MHDTIINVHRSSSTHYSYQILKKREYSEQIFKKYPITKLHLNPFSGSRVAPYGWTDRHDFVNTPKRDFITQESNFSIPSHRSLKF